MSLFSCLAFFLLLVVEQHLAFEERGFRRALHTVDDTVDDGLVLPSDDGNASIGLLKTAVPHGDKREHKKLVSNRTTTVAVDASGRIIIDAVHTPQPVYVDFSGP